MPEPMITTRWSRLAAARGGLSQAAGTAEAKAAAPAPPRTARRDTAPRSRSSPAAARSASTSAASSGPQPVRRAQAATACACRSARSAGDAVQSMRTSCRTPLRAPYNAVLLLTVAECQALVAGGADGPFARRAREGGGRGERSGEGAAAADRPLAAVPVQDHGVLRAAVDAGDV